MTFLGMFFSSDRSINDRALHDVFILVHACIVYFSLSFRQFLCVPLAILVGDIFDRQHKSLRDDYRNLILAITTNISVKLCPPVEHIMTSYSK